LCGENQSPINSNPFQRNPTPFTLHKILDGTDLMESGEIPSDIDFRKAMNIQ